MEVARAARRLMTILVAAVVCVLVTLLAVGTWFLFQPDVPIKPFSTAPRTSGVMPDVPQDAAIARHRTAPVVPAAA